MPVNKNRPTVRHGKKILVSIPGEVNGVELRSQLEVQFAQELQKREIQWRYEPERIGAGHYLVDFYLTELKCWVEVKGRYDAREDLLLPNVAINLKRDRGEKLYLWMDDDAYLVGPREYTKLTHEEFWAAIQKADSP